MALFPPNHVVSVRGARNGKTCWARDIEVRIFATQDLPVIDQIQGIPEFKYGIHWDPDDTLDDGTADGSPLDEGDILLWSRYPGQSLGLSNVTFHVLDIDGEVTLPTAYFWPVAVGEQGQS
jgi:hypothetical protein